MEISSLIPINSIQNGKLIKGFQVFLPHDWKRIAQLLAVTV